MTTGSAPAKIILFGEHSVVYGRPALAVPLSELRARARVQGTADRGIIIHAQDLSLSFSLDTASEADPLASITRAALDEIQVAPTGLELWIESEIPLASGLGSGAAVSTAIVRALAAHFGREVSAERVSELVFETEKLYHGTPSGIDNNVIALERPIRFAQVSGAQPVLIAKPFTLLIGQTGIRSPTRITVADVRRGWQAEPTRYERLFDSIADVVKEAEAALANGLNDQLGPLMDQNQALLRELNVSSEKVEKLLAAAKEAGAIGGKLSGAGRGGNVIVYARQRDLESVRLAMMNAGATQVLAAPIRST